MMCLSRVQSLRLAAPLEDCSQQLDILEHALTVQLNRERGAAAAQEKARLWKLTSDCQYMSQLMGELHLELEEKQSFSSLLWVVEEIEQKRRDGNMKGEAQRELKIRKQTLLKQQEELQQKSDKLKNLQVRVLKAQMKENLLEMRRKENDTGLQLKKIQNETSQAEALLEEELELLKKQLKEKTRVHEESEEFLRNQHEELQQLVCELRQYTAEMVQEHRKQFINVRFKRNENLERLEEMKSKFVEMEKVVMEDREEQDKLHQEEARVRAATKLQAWWRGCMVRRGLGSFKKAEKGKKGPKKEGNKKKKK